MIGTRDEEKSYSNTSFVSGKWNNEINVRDFIQCNYTPYEGDSSFLVAPTEKTKKLWNEVLELYKKEKELGSCGINVLIYLKKNVKMAAFWTWIPKLYQQ